MAPAVAEQAAEKRAAATVAARDGQQHGFSEKSHPIGEYNGFTRVSPAW